jgi:molecular chaperone DnaK (HSP70)
VEVKPSYGLSEEQVEAMIRESYDKAEEDMRERQVREARVEADTILTAIDKAMKHEAYQALEEEERLAIDKARRELMSVYHLGDHHAISDKIAVLNQVTMNLAENMMNTAVRGALKGTKI